MMDVLAKLQRHTFLLPYLRRYRKPLVMAGLLLVIIVFWEVSRASRQEINVTSAIICKGRIVDIVFPLPKDRRDFLPAIDTNVKTSENDFFEMLSSTQTQCFLQKRMGRTRDGSWQVCLDSAYDLRQPCIVYSFGVGFDFGFEEEVAKEGCIVHAFDPSMGVTSYQHSKNIFFYNSGIADINGHSTKYHWKLQTLDRIMKELGHQKTVIDLMKLDVEFSEWPALYQMIRSGSLARVKQLAVEFHTPEMDILAFPDHRCSKSSPEFFTFALKILLELYNSGFRIFYTVPNHRITYESPFTYKERYCCYNVHFININAN